LQYHCLRSIGRGFHSVPRGNEFAMQLRLSPYGRSRAGDERHGKGPIERLAKGRTKRQGAHRLRELERLSNEIKHCRAIGKRYGKLARNFLAAVQLVAAIILLD